MPRASRGHKVVECRQTAALAKRQLSLYPFFRAQFLFRRIRGGQLGCYIRKEPNRSQKIAATK